MDIAEDAQVYKNLFYNFRLIGNNLTPFLSGSRHLKSAGKECQFGIFLVHVVLSP